MPYNTIAVRELLMAAFDNEAFNNFCCTHARSLQQQFTADQPQENRVQLLIEYAVRHNQLEEILNAVEQSNPYLFSTFRPDLMARNAVEDQPVMVQRLPLPLQKYDPFFGQWVRELARLDLSERNYARSVVAGLAAALQAELGLVLVNQGVTWEPAVTLDDRATREARRLTENSRIRELLYQATQHQTSTYAGTFDATGPFLFVPFAGAKEPSLLVFTGLRGSFAPDSTIGVVLETILETTSNLTLPVSAETLELRVYDALRRRIGIVSDAMYNRQFELYSRRLERMTVHFEPIVYLHPTQPYIWGWEALAREHGAVRAPVDLFKIAELWGTRFQLELDMHFLKAAVAAYVYDIEGGAKRRRAQGQLVAQSEGGRKRRPLRARKEELQPLAVNAYPVSLAHIRYYEALRELYLDGVMPLNKLTIEISEKLELPKPDGADAYRDPYDWFREHLQRLEQFDVRFAIDDFGVGMASPERLSRMGVSVVKIDRTALLSKFGDTTINYVTDFARSVPGSMQVIVEGVDYDSLFPLRALFDAHVRYVQGHRLGMARPDVDRLTKQDVEQIRAALQAPAHGKP